MLRQDLNRIDPKRRHVDHRKKQFADPTYKETAYPTRLNFYATPPTAEITLEQFEQWAIDRLRILAELEACSFRNKNPTETASHMKPLLDKYLPLEANSSSSSQLAAQRQKDHYSHFILRLAFSSTEDLRRRFSRVESALFRMRLAADDPRERALFISGLSLDWEPVSEDERRELAAELAATSAAVYGKRNAQQQDDESWCKVDWERVPDLVESRRVFLRAGKAYVPAKEQTSMVSAEFTARLERALEVSRLVWGADQRGAD
jgi:DNA primase large subunit